ncbi:PepSY domain-containing protein [Roseimicrobium sp. ORNL1]|uniref:PepSY domain-containing protein n=1 Tax=Roseimicrobium sp. ORNL1 TaxID=2711231 RepID=UPI0013E1C04E|nr:PepSY domain-containing protein [Roseimicrobium sp. ORNL1]QIE99980.1 hypothetical protein G5S37_00050 [Roseimicrobium sp. ORNL1]
MHLLHHPWHLFIATVCLCGAVSCQSTRTEPALVIVRSQAEAAALAEAPGSTIIGGGLEKRDDRWVWAFQALPPDADTPRELLVNARTGYPIRPKSAAAVTPQGTEATP